MKLRLTESDLRFLVETVATRRRDHEHIIGLVRDKDDLLEPMLEDPKVVERLLNDQEAFVEVSPYLMFAALLRRVRRDLEGRSFVLERQTRGRRIPVFDAPQAAQLIGEPATRDYLTEMLCSFVRTHTGVLWWKEGGTWHQRRFSDVDLDDLMALCQLVEPAYRPRLYKRIADVALFLAGIYPDHAAWGSRRVRSPAAVRRSMPDYEREGRRFYALAAREAAPPWPASVFEALAEKFTLAREALNTLSDRYLKALRARYFEPPVG